MREIQVGEMIYSKFFDGWIKVIRKDSNTDWWFMDARGNVLKAQTPLRYFEAREDIMTKGGE